jgi:hypothetical protein
VVVGRGEGQAERIDQRAALGSGRQGWAMSCTGRPRRVSGSISRKTIVCSPACFG